MTFTAQHRDRLRDVRDRTKAARKQRADLNAALEAAQRVGDTDTENVINGRLNACETELEMAQGVELALLSQAAGVGGGGFGSESFLDDPAMISQLEHIANSSSPPERLSLGPIMGLDEFVRMIDEGSWGPPQRMAAAVLPDTPAGRRGPWSELGVVRQLRRRIRILDLIPTRPMLGNSVPFTIESGGLDTAAETVEASLKPVGDIELVDQEARARTIANFIKAPRQILADVPELATVVSDRLTYTCLRRLEDQIVSGDGTGENLTGLLAAATAVPDIPFVPATPAADLILAGLTAVEVANAVPDSILIHPQTAQAMLTVKAVGSGEYLSIDGPFGTEPTTLWGLPFVASTVVPLNKAIVGSLGQGAILWIREPVHVVAGLDSDDWTRNKITLLGELRAALTIIQPTAFAIVELAA